MKYESLYSIYYKDPAAWEKTYDMRISSPFTRLLPVSIRQYNRTAEHPTFYCYTEEVALLQERILSGMVECLSVIQKISDVSMSQFYQNRLIEEIKCSNDIEGVRSTRREILAAFAVTERERSSYRLGSIVSKYMKIIQGECLPLRNSLDVRMLFDQFLSDEIARDDGNNLPDGKVFRKESVDIISATQKTIHRGVYPETKIIQMMDRALTLLQDKTIPFLIRIAIFHYLFGYIHPFYDGNGRMDRFITSYLLAKKLHPAVALQVSILIKQYRKAYYDLFSHTDADINRGDLTPFILGALEFIERAISSTSETLCEKQILLSKQKERLQQTEIWKNAGKTMKSVLEMLLQSAVFSGYGITVKEIMETLHVSENTVYNQLRKLPPALLFVNQTIRPYRYNLLLGGLGDGETERLGDVRR